MSTPIGKHGNALADEDKVFVCMACGKLSADRYGDKKISRGWDESCMMHAVEVHKDALKLSPDGTRAVEVKQSRT